MKFILYNQYDIITLRIAKIHLAASITIIQWIPYHNLWYTEDKLDNISKHYTRDTIPSITYHNSLYTEDKLDTITKHHTLDTIPYNLDILPPVADRGVSGPAILWGPLQWWDPTFASWRRWKPPGGVRGRATEANAFWQQHIEKQISWSPSTPIIPNW